MHKIELRDIGPVVIIEVNGMLLNDASAVASHEDPVAILQGDPGKSVFSFVASAVRPPHAKAVQRFLHMLRNCVVSEDTHKIRGCTEFFRIYGKIQRLPSGVHDSSVQVHITDVVPDSQYSQHGFPLRASNGTAPRPHFRNGAPLYY